MALGLVATAVLSAVVGGGVWPEGGSLSHGQTSGLDTGQLGFVSQYVRQVEKNTAIQ